MAAVQSLKKGKSAGVDNIPAKLVQAGGEDVITALTTMRNTVWQTGECIISRVFNDLAPSTAHSRIFLDVTDFCCYCCRFCSFLGACFFFACSFVCLVLTEYVLRLDPQAGANWAKRSRDVLTIINLGHC